MIKRKMTLKSFALPVSDCCSDVSEEGPSLWFSSVSSGDRSEHKESFLRVSPQETHETVPV